MNTSLSLFLTVVSLGSACSDNSLSVLDDRPPEVTILSPVEQSLLLEGESMWLRGAVQDDETATDLLEIYWESSLSGGFTGALLVDGTEVSMEIHQGLESGEHTLSLIAIDAAGTAVTDDVRVTVEPNTPPVADLISPTDGATLYNTGEHTLIAAVSDAHDAVEDLVMIWSSNLDGQLAGFQEISGNTVVFDIEGALSPGIHTLHLEVFDTLGAYGSDQAEVDVAADENEPPTVSFRAPSPESIYDYLDVVYVEAFFTDDVDSLETLALTWGGMTDLDWIDEELPAHPTTGGTVGVTFALDCIYYNSLETSTFQLILTAEDTEGASGQASVTFESYCKPLD